MMVSSFHSTAGNFVRRAFIIIIVLCLLASSLFVANAIDSVPTATVGGGELKDCMAAFDGDGYIYILEVPSGTSEKEVSPSLLKLQPPEFLLRQRMMPLYFRLFNMVMMISTMTAFLTHTPIIS